MSKEGGVGDTKSSTPLFPRVSKEDDALSEVNGGDIFTTILITFLF